jgi:hypothetical protein
VTEYGADWSTGAELALTAPPGSGWTAQLELSARQKDGRRTEWTEDAPLGAETALHTVSAPPGDTGAVTLLVARISYVHEDGSVLRGPMLQGRFVVAAAGRYVETPARFRSYVMDGGFVDPHDSLALDGEVTR